MSWTTLKLIRWTAGYLTDRGIADPRLDAELLLADSLGVKRLDLYLQHDRPLLPEELAEFKTRLRRRARREPLQYIAGEASFRNLRLEVDRRVLIPRPETEVLVEEVLRWCRGKSGLVALDIGTGSGAIALSLAGEGTCFDRVVATDASPDALAVARANAAAIDSAGVVELRTGECFDPVAGERFDVVVSNPPYVAETERSALQPEVVDWEPALALFSGDDGLGIIRRIVSDAPRYLQPGGLLALEIGAAQGEAVRGLIHSTPGLTRVQVKPDLNGRDRIVLAELA